MWPNRRGHLLAGSQSERPSYEALAGTLRNVPGSRSARSWLERVNPFSSGQVCILCLCRLLNLRVRLFVRP